jgi:hypothetical protein
VDRVHGAVNRRCARVHGGLWAAWTLGAAALGLARAHRRGATGIGGHGELDGLLTRGRAVVWRQGDDGEERRRLELVARAKEGAKGLRREGKRCGEVWGVARLL